MHATPVLQMQSGGVPTYEQEVAAWLQENNLGQHISLFTSNDIRGAALLQLNHAVLKEMGIHIVGDRLRLLAAIRALHKMCASGAGHTAATPPVHAPVTTNMLATPSKLPSPTTPLHPHAGYAPMAAHPSPSTLSPPMRAISPNNMSPLAPIRQLRPQSMERHYSDMDNRSSSPSLLASPVSTVGPSPHLVAPTAPAQAMPASLTPNRLTRPNTSTGVSHHTSSSSRSLQAAPAYRGNLAATPSRRPATSNASASSGQVGYTVGRGAFAPKSRVSQISAPYNLRRGESSDWEEPRGSDLGQSSQGQNVPSLETIRKHIVKFLAEDGTSRSVDVSRCRQASDVLAKVLHKFGALTEPDSTQYMRRWVVAMTGANAQLKVLSEIELMTVCSQPHIYDPVWQHGLYLLRTTDEAPLRPGSQREVPVDKFRAATAPTTRRASTFSILSGLGGGELHSTAPSAAPATGPAAPSTDGGLSPTRLTPRGKPKTPTDATGPLPNVRRRVRNFFGQRPSSELISSHLAEYFPATDSRELNRHSRQSLEVSGQALSTGTLTPTATLYSASLKRAEDTGDDTSSLVTLDEVTQDLEGRQSLGSTSTPTSSAPSMTAVTAPSLRSGTEPEPESVSGSSLAMVTTPTRTETSAQPSNAPPPGTSVTSPTKPGMRWHRGALIGAGSFGKVFLGMNAKTGLLMAVKQVELPQRDDENTRRRRLMVDSLEAEIELLKSIQHPNVVQYLDSNTDGMYLNIFLEYVPGGSVVALLRNYGAFEEPLVCNFVRQILQGLSFLHSRDIVHRDIKGANILVDNKGGVKISDFGISKKMEGGLLVPASAKRPVLQGSVFWMAPEVVKQSVYTPKADIWSVGCCVVEMFTGAHPWPQLDQMQALFQIGMGKSPSIPDDISPFATQFLQRTFELDYQSRFSAADLLGHAFVSQLNDADEAEDNEAEALP